MSYGGVKRTQLYKLCKKWLRSIMRSDHFGLYERKDSAFHRLPMDVEDWLHKELSFIRKEANLYRGRFNFAVLAEEAVKSIIDMVKETLSKGEAVILRRFGSFSLRDKRKRVGRNPKTGTEVEITARRVVRFKAGKYFKDAVNK